VEQVRRQERDGNGGEQSRACVENFSPQLKDEHQHRKIAKKI
jgi:hypothetical protein